MKTCKKSVSVYNEIKLSKEVPFMIVIRKTASVIEISGASVVSSSTAGGAGIFGGKRVSTRQEHIR